MNQLNFLHNNSIFSQVIYFNDVSSFHFLSNLFFRCMCLLNNVIMVSFSRYCHVGWWWGLSLKNINVSNYSGFFFSFDIFFKVSSHMQFSGWSLFGHKWDLQVYVKPQVDERDYASFTDNQVATSSLIELSNRIYESDKIGFWWFVFLIGIRQNAASCYHIMQVTFRRKQIKLCFHWSRAHLQKSSATWHGKIKILRSGWFFEATLMLCFLF